MSYIDDGWDYGVFKNNMINIDAVRKIKVALEDNHVEQLNRIEEKLDQLLAAQKKKYVQLRTVNK